MEHPASQDLKGIWCSIQLSIQANNAIDFKHLEEEINFLTNTSVEGLYSNGTAAEFYNQSESEFDRINELLSGICHKKKVPFQIGASHMSPIISRERIKRARAFDPVAFQIILPDWVPLNPEEQRSFLTGMVEIAAPIPIVLYTPGHSKTKLGPTDFKRLSKEFRQLAGIKTGGGDSEWYREMREVDSNVSVFVPGHRLATGMKEGVAKGSFSNVACIDPDAAQKWYEIMLEDIEQGLKIEKQILKFFDVCIFPLARSGYSDAALDKLLWSLSDRNSGCTRLRWPYLGVSNHILDGIRKEARRILPAFFQI